MEFRILIVVSLVLKISDCRLDFLTFCFLILGLTVGFFAEKRFSFEDLACHIYGEEIAPLERMKTEKEDGLNVVVG